MQSFVTTHGRPKRKQVKNACVNCQKACKKCDDGRPCQRCIKYGLIDTCANSVRKERKKGIKRGPYKKRKQGDGSTGESPAPAAPPSSLPAALYAPTTQAAAAAAAVAAAAGVRTNGVLAYQPFQSGSYDAFHAAVSYQNSASIMSHPYMVPAAIQQMYPTNSILSYQAAMNMLSPQHGQSSSNIYGYRPDSTPQTTSTTQQAEDQQDNGQKEQQQQQQGSHEGSPASPTGASTPNNGVKVENAPESDDERSKLNILSQLCSAVLDRAPNPPPKQEDRSSPQPSCAEAEKSKSVTPTDKDVPAKPKE
ncbi:hypothetical protein BX666DRAFT_1936062 [Dichotomocladium elegans]|nr:hypothetical protein BX666DRAFT_1936062 [Dichotomocladium elegans]